MQEQAVNVIREELEKRKIKVIIIHNRDSPHFI